MASTLVVIPHQLRGRGFRFTRLSLSRMDGKAPIDKDFYDGGALREDDSRLLSHIEAGNGYGMVCNYGDLMAFDADQGAILEEMGIMARLPATLTDRAPNKPESFHLYYVCSGLPQTFHFYHLSKVVEVGCGEAKEMKRLELGQICAGRGHIVGPNSPHHKGGHREIIDDSPLVEITVDDLKKILEGVAFSEDPTKNPTFDEVAGLVDTSAWGELRAKEKVARKARRGGDDLTLSERIGDIRRILSAYGWSPTTKSGDEWKGDVPGEPSKSKTALSVNVAEGLWYCHHHADSGGDAAALVALFEELIDCRGKDRLRDPSLFKAVLKACEEKGLIPSDDDQKTDEPEARDFLETVKDGIKEDPRKLKDRAVLAALLTLREKDPLEFDLFSEDLKAAGVVKLPTLKKMIDGEERRQATEEVRADVEDERPEVPADIKARAREILETGDPIKARCDYVSGTVEGNAGVAKAFTYSCSSAYMPAEDKFHTDAVGASQGGKSVTVGTVHMTYPPENLEILTEASPKSVYYLAKKYEEEGRSFDDVILYINDARVEHIPVLKVFRDDGPGAPRNLTVVDGESLDLVVPGRPVVQSSSVLPLRDDEGQAVSRSFLATVADVDEAGEKKVRGKIRWGLQYGALRRPDADTEKAVLQQMSRILRDEGIRDIVIPFDSPEPSSADRRGTGQFVRLIKISAHENQFQRPILEMKDGRRFVLATYADLQNAADLWFEFEEAQAFKINHKVLKVFKSLPTTEPDHYNFTDSSPSINRIAKDTEISPKSVERYLSDLYDAGLIYRKKAGAPGNPYVFWTTDQLRQKVMSQISTTRDGKGDLGQIETKNGCLKYLSKNCPDSLKNSSKAFFTNQDIIKKENVKGIYGILAEREWSVSGGDILSSIGFLVNRVLNAPIEAADSEYLRQRVLSQMSEMPTAIDPKMGEILSKGEEDVSKDGEEGPGDVGDAEPEGRQTIAENLAEGDRRQAEHLARFKTPESKSKPSGRPATKKTNLPEEDEPNLSEPSDEIKAEALEIVAGLNGKAITFGNVEAYLEARAGGFVPPKAVKRALNALAAMGGTTDKNGILTMPEGVAL